MKQRLPKQETKPEPRDAVHALIEHLDGNFSETYDRLALARRFNMNEDYMVKLFKKVTGTNIANYINTRRIEAARQLLEETDSRVIDIAFHVGFDNLTYFYRHFKKQTGYSPIEYRRMFRNTTLHHRRGVTSDGITVSCHVPKMIRIILDRRVVIYTIGTY